MSAEAAVPEKSSKILYGIQVLRGVGALLVVLRHTAKILEDDSPDAFAHGQFGVDIFFIISGLVIFLTGRTQKAGEFLTRRLIRIVPIYWLILGVNILGDIARQKDGPNMLSNALWSFAFIPSLNMDNEVFPPATVGWSLNFEMYFYLICAGVILTLGAERLLRGTTAVILCAVVVGFATRSAVPWKEYPIMVLLLPLTLEFLAGMWIAHFSLAGRKSPPIIAALLAIGAVIWVAVGPTATPYDEWRVLSWGIPALALVWAVLSTEKIIGYHKWKPALALGDSSYALYLVHPIVLGVLAALFNKFHFVEQRWLMFVIMVACSLIAGQLTHWLIERPMMRVLSSIIKTRKPMKIGETAVAG